MPQTKGYKMKKFEARNPLLLCEVARYVVREQIQMTKTKTSLAMKQRLFCFEFWKFGF